MFTLWWYEPRFSRPRWNTSGLLATQLWVWCAINSNIVLCLIKSVKASGSPPMAYFWQFRSVLLVVVKSLVPGPLSSRSWTHDILILRQEANHLTHSKEYFAGKSHDTVERLTGLHIDSSPEYWKDIQSETEDMFTTLRSNLLMAASTCS